MNLDEIGIKNGRRPNAPRTRPFSRRSHDRCPPLGDLRSWQCLVAAYCKVVRKESRLR